MNEPLAAIFITLVIAAIVATWALPDASKQFTAEECTTVPTGRTQKSVTVVRNAQGQPQAIDEHIVGLEYATLCQRTEWRQ